MRVCILRMVTAEGNHNKVYIMRQISNSEFVAEYGREGASLQKKQYSMNRFDALYDQKIRKGYEDVTRFQQTVVAPKTSSKYAEIPDEVVRALVDDLLRYSNKVIKKEYKVSYENVTQEMIDEAEEILSMLIQKYPMGTSFSPSDIYYIQSELLDLWKIIPRRMKNVSDALYHDGQDIQKYLAHEAEILDVMRGRVNTNQQPAKKGKKSGQTILEAYGISIEPIVKQESIMQIKKHMDDYSRVRFRDAFRVSNKKAEERFYAFMKANGYTDKDVHWLYHGSRNQNIFGLLTKSYLINSGAIRTGSMYGTGIYTADLARKSLGYTSLGESVWNHESSRTGFLFLNKVLYKNPKHVYTWTSECGRFNKRNIGNHDAVFAHKGTSIRNNEYIVYDESQILAHTLIRLKTI